MIKKIKRHHLREIAVYGVVGGGAWVVQTIIFLLMVKMQIFPSVGMILGTLGGFLVSYFGHTHLTFRKTHRFSHTEFMKFMVTSVIGLCINVGGVRVITKVLLLDPLYGIIPTIFTPFVTFLISKFWAFKGK